MLLETETFGIPAKMNKFLKQEEVDKTLKRLKAAKQKKAQKLTKEQRAIIKANKKAGKEMERKWAAGDTKYKH